jgi:hypothetical protein
MDDLHRRIHANEFAAHMALFASGPVWQHLFGTTVEDKNIIAVQEHMIAAEEPLTADQITQGVQRNLGDAAVAWMWNAFISTAEPRAAGQIAVLQAFVRPTVTPGVDPDADAFVARVLTGARHQSLLGLEALMEQTALLPPDPRDSVFIEATAGFISPVAPLRRLTDSIYLAILAPAVAYA